MCGLYIYCINSWYTFAITFTFNCGVSKAACALFSFNLYLRWNSKFFFVQERASKQTTIWRAKQNKRITRFFYSSWSKFLSAWKQNTIDAIFFSFFWFLCDSRTILPKRLYFINWIYIFANYSKIDWLNWQCSVKYKQYVWFTSKMMYVGSVRFFFLLHLLANFNSNNNKMRCDVHLLVSVNNKSFISIWLLDFRWSSLI